MACSVHFSAVVYYVIFSEVEYNYAVEQAASQIVSRLQCSLRVSCHSGLMQAVRQTGKHRMAAVTHLFSFHFLVIRNISMTNTKLVKDIVLLNPKSRELTENIPNWV